MKSRAWETSGTVRVSCGQASLQIRFVLLFSLFLLSTVEGERLCPSLLWNGLCFQTHLEHGSKRNCPRLLWTSLCVYSSAHVPATKKRTTICDLLLLDIGKCMDEQVFIVEKDMKNGVARLAQLRCGDTLLRLIRCSSLISLSLSYLSFAHSITHVVLLFVSMDASSAGRYPGCLR